MAARWRMDMSIRQLWTFITLRHVLLALLAALVSWGSAQTAPGTTVTLSKTSVMWGETVTATVSNGSCYVNEDVGGIVWQWGMGGTSALSPVPGTNVAGGQVQFQTPPIGTGTSTISVPWYCPIPLNNFTLTYTPSFNVTWYVPSMGNTTDYAEANTPYVYVMNNTVKDVIYTVQWGDNTADNWTGDGSPSHTFQHTYSPALASQAYPLKSFGTIKFVDRRGGIHTEGGASYPMTLTAMKPSVALKSPATTSANTDVVIEYTNLIPGKTYTVNWGDATSEPVVGALNPVAVKHQYKKDGIYTITTNGSVNLTNAAPITVTVQSPPPTLSVTGTGLNAALSLSGLQGSTDYSVDWGDGSPVSIPARDIPSQTLNHVYAAPGTYTIKLFSSSPTALGTTTFNATLGAVNLNFTPPKPVIGEQVILTLSGLSPSATYELNWGDGTVEAGINGQTSVSRSHTYASAQDFVVKVSNSGAPLGNTTVPVQVPTPTLTPSVQGLNLTLQVQGLVANAVYNVTWGDGTTEALTAAGPSATLTHTYAVPGAVTVTVTPARGTAASVPVTLVASQPTLTVTPATAYTDDPLTATMNDLVKTLTYTLKWGDGLAVPFTATDVQATQTHSYANPGVYPVELSSPNVNPVGTSVTVKPGAPILNLTGNVLTVTLNATKLFNGVSYTVDWGAGVTERFVASGPGQTLTHNYAAPGPQTVTVTPDAGKPATATVNLTVSGPNLSVTPVQGQTDGSFTATLGSLVPALTYTLNWGDGSTEPVTGVSTLTRTHSYAAPGTFTVTLTYAGLPPVQQTVTVRVPAPILSGINDNLTLNLQLSGLVTTATYTVAWGDGQQQSLTATAPTASLTHTYATAGAYTVTVTPALGNPATLSVNVQIVSVPAPILTVVPLTANVYTDVKADFSGLTAVLSYTLDWGDGVREDITGVTGGQRTHSYARAGTYPVNLKAPQSPAATVSVTISQPVPVLTVTSSALAAQANLSNLIKALTYHLDWGDSMPPADVTGVDATTLSHTYARPGPYTLTLTVAGGSPVTATVNVTVPAATLTVTSVDLTATATVAGLQSSLPYTLNWGDGSSSTLIGKPTDTLTHAYAKPGPYNLQLATPGTADVTATVNIVVKPLTLVVVSPELRATATLGGLVRAMTYTVNWSDGTQDTVTGQESVTLTHAYAKPGQYTVIVTAPGLEPVSTTFIAGLPPQEAMTATPGQTPDVQDIRITGLIPGGNYLLDYGDGQTEPLFFTGQTGRWTHRYLKSGIYTLTLNLRTPDGMGSVRAVATVQAQQPMTVGAANLIFTKNPTGTTLTLTTLDAIPLKLNVPYSGSGTLTGQWVIDGQTGPTVTLDLPEGGNLASADYTVSPPQPGQHTVSFQITGVTPRCIAACLPPILPGVNSLSYTLDVPSALTYGGLKVTLTNVTQLDPQAFSASGTVRLIVAGVDLGPQPVTLTGVKVSRNATEYAVTGGDTTVNLGSLALRALNLGQADVRLQTLTLTPDGAALSGTVSLPGASALLSFKDAPLKDSELLAELSSTTPLRGVQIGSTGISFAAASGVLDLSSKESPDALSSAYARATTGSPGPDWMGIVLPGANLTIGTSVLSTPSQVSAPVAYTLGGYTTAFDLPSSTVNFGGWTVKSSGLKAALNASSLTSFEGQGSLTVPMVNEALSLNISWNPQLGNPGTKWVFSAAAPPKIHDFGRTKLEFNTPALETRGDGSVKLVFSNAKWNLGGVSGKEVKVSLYNLTFTPDGDVTLGDKAWASATGMTDFTLFDYPFPTAEVGTARQANGEYTLSLRGKIQLGQALPLNAILQPVNFWVKDGKDEKIEFEKIRLYGEIKTVEFDVAVSAMFKDATTLEFIGEGYIKVAKRIRVAAKAGFGMDKGTGYGFFWAAYRSPTLKPFVTVGDVGFYEFNGGVGINMVWPQGNFEVPPVKAIPPADARRVVNIAIQGGAVFGTAFDNGTIAHFRGTLGIDTEGTIAIKAVGWLFTPLELGAFSTNTARVASASGQQLNTVSTNGSLAPNAAALVVVSVPPDRPDSGYILVQGCAGPAEQSSVGGVDCTGNRDLTFYDLITLRGYLEVYMPFSGSGQHVYLGTKANPIGVRLLGIGSSSTTKTTTAPVKNADGTTTPSTTTDTYGSSNNTPDKGSTSKTSTKASGIEGNGYLMLDSTSTRVGLGINFAYSIGQSGSGKVCDWYWYAKAYVGLNADFIVAYQPVSLDAQLTLTAGASAGVGACGIPLDVGIDVTLNGRMYISAQSRFFEGTASGVVIMPIIPNIPFSVSARADF